MKKHSLNGNQKHVLLTGKSKGTSSSECKKGGEGGREILRPSERKGEGREEERRGKLAGLSSSMTATKQRMPNYNSKCSFFLQGQAWDKKYLLW